MGWVWIDDQYTEHPKLVGLGAWCEVAGWLNLAAVGWSNRYLTDGVVPKSAVWRLAIFRGMTIDGEPVTPEAVAVRLVESTLWEERGASYVIHDFLDYQHSREVVLARRAADRQRKQPLAGSGRSPRGILPESGRIPASPTPTPTERTPDARARATQVESRTRAQDGTPDRTRATVKPAKSPANGRRYPPRRAEPAAGPRGGAPLRLGELLQEALARQAAARDPPAEPPRLVDAEA